MSKKTNKTNLERRLNSSVETLHYPAQGGHTAMEDLGYQVNSYPHVRHEEYALHTKPFADSHVITRGSDGDRVHGYSFIDVISLSDTEKDSVEHLSKDQKQHIESLATTNPEAAIALLDSAPHELEKSIFDLLFSGSKEPQFVAEMVKNTKGIRSLHSWRTQELTSAAIYCLEQGRFTEFYKLCLNQNIFFNFIKNDELVKLPAEPFFALLEYEARTKPRKICHQVRFGLQQKNVNENNEKDHKHFVIPKGDLSELPLDEKILAQLEENIEILRLYQNVGDVKVFMTTEDGVLSFTVVHPLMKEVRDHLSAVNNSYFFYEEALTDKVFERAAAIKKILDATGASSLEDLKYESIPMQTYNFFSSPFEMDHFPKHNLTIYTGDELIAPSTLLYVFYPKQVTYRADWNSAVGTLLASGAVSIDTKLLRDDLDDCEKNTDISTSSLSGILEGFTTEQYLYLAYVYHSCVYKAPLFQIESTIQPYLKAEIDDERIHHLLANVAP